ncbi:Patellin-3 [Sarracenia purpurea var. burkii]
MAETSEELVATVTEKETPSPLPAPAPVLEPEPPVKPESARVEVIESETPNSSEPRTRKGGPESQASFKEESNKVADLSDLERTALEELRLLVLEALNHGEFTYPPPPAVAPVVEELKTKLSFLAENPPEATPAVDKEIATYDGSETSKTLISSSSEEVSIWGVPLLMDDRTDAILLKFLRAREFKVKDAFVMLRNTIHWRKEFKIDALVDEDLGDDLEKVVFMQGFDKEGHPVCYNVYGEFQNKELYQKTFGDEEKRMSFLRWRIQFLERTIRKLDFWPGGICTIFQVSDLKNSPGPGKRELRLATRLALQLLQDNYPEFVAKQVFINVPWWSLAFYTMISPFLTQRTKSKFVFSGPSRTAETLFKYVSPEQVPIQYGGLCVDPCDCNPEFGVDDPSTVITVKPATKQTVEIQVYEKCIIVWEVRVVGWEVSYSAEFVPNDKDSYTMVIQKAKKISPTDEAVISKSFKISQLGKLVLAVDNPTSKRKKFVYRFKVKPFCN